MLSAVDCKLTVFVRSEYGKRNDHVFGDRIEREALAKPHSRLHPFFHPYQSARRISGKPLLRCRVVKFQPDVIVMTPSENGISVSAFLHLCAGRLASSRSVRVDIDFVNSAQRDVQFPERSNRYHRQLVTVSTLAVDDFLNRPLLVIGRLPFEVRREPTNDGLRPPHLRRCVFGDLLCEGF